MSCTLLIFHLSILKMPKEVAVTAKSHQLLALISLPNPSSLSLQQHHTHFDPAVTHPVSPYSVVCTCYCSRLFLSPNLTTFLDPSSSVWNLSHRFVRNASLDIHSAATGLRPRFDSVTVLWRSPNPTSCLTREQLSYKDWKYLSCLLCDEHSVSALPSRSLFV